MHEAILTLNAGSATLKFALYATGETPEPLLRGLFDLPEGGVARLRVDDVARGTRDERTTDARAPDAVLREIRAELDRRAAGARVVAVGHRIVHGGPTVSDHVLFAPSLEAALAQAELLAPEHLPRERAYLSHARAAFAVPHALCFDTVFHHDLPAVARELPLPRRLAEAGVRRYGFHGLSYAFLVQRLGEIAGARAAEGRVVLAHLGSGASLAAVREGRSVDTTMGFTPTAGLVMGTRTGDLDPGIAAYLESTEGMTAGAWSRMASHESGLLGLSGRSADVRELLAAEAEDPRAALALGVFVHQARKHVAAMAASLGGLDTFVFAGGIGENSPEIRERISDGLGFLGVAIDPDANRRNAETISSAGSKVVVRVIPTDEERYIAATTQRLLSTRLPAPPLEERP